MPIYLWWFIQSHISVDKGWSKDMHIWILLQSSDPESLYFQLMFLLAKHEPACSLKLHQHWNKDVKFCLDQWMKNHVLFLFEYVFLRLLGESEVDEHIGNFSFFFCDSLFLWFI